MNTACIDRSMLLIKAITLYRLRAESDFLFAFSSFINIAGPSANRSL